MCQAERNKELAQNIPLTCEKSRTDRRRAVPGCRFCRSVFMGALGLGYSGISGGAC